MKFLARGTFVLLAVVALLTASRVRAEEQRETVEQRLERLEKLLAETRAELAAVKAAAGADPQRLREIERQIEVLAREIEQWKLGEAAPPAPESKDARYGVGPAAAKVYGKKGVSIGGYGEFLYQGFAGSRQDGEPSGLRNEADLAHAVLYFGYKFDDRWILNTEVEVEHAVSASDKGGEVEVEFAYLDYLFSKSLRHRLLAGFLVGKFIDVLPTLFEQKCFLSGHHWVMIP